VISRTSLSNGAVLRAASSGEGLQGGIALKAPPAQMLPPVHGESPPSIFPADLFDRALSSDGNEPGPVNWWVLHTRSRQEKKVGELLHALSVPFYLPLLRCTSPSRGRTRTVWTPLFSGYVFLWGGDNERLAALKTKRLAAIHRVVDGKRLGCDLAGFASLIAKGVALTPESRIVAGQRVRVKSGPFIGQEGMVMKRRGKTKLLVVLAEVLQGASMDIEDYLLEAV
jgi:transcription antitermination factor NusG